MQISIFKTLLIIFLSSMLGIAVNSLSSRRIPFIYEKQEISWGSDSLVSMILEKGEPGRDTSMTEKIQQTSPPFEENHAAEVNSAGKDKIEEKPSSVTDKALNEPVKIDLETAYNLYNKNILFVDARPIEEFTEGHISGAYSMPYYDKNIEERLITLDKEQPVVVYCSGTDCDLSIMLGNKMHKLGFNKVFVFFGGWDDWLSKKYPVETQE